MATKGRSGMGNTAKFIAEAQARRQRFADGGVPGRSLVGRMRDSISRGIGDRVDSLRANTPFESATARAVREQAANNGLGINPVKRDNFANGMDGVQTREKQLEQQERANMPDSPQQTQQAPKPELQASEIKFANGTPYVEGPGTATSDSIPARLSKGEAVLPAKTVQTLGVDTVADLIESTAGKKPKTIGDSVRGKYAVGGVPDPKKLVGVQVANTPEYQLPANPKPNLNTDIAKGGVTTFSETPSAPVTTDVDKPAYQRRAVLGDARAVQTMNTVDAAAKGVGSGSAAAGSAATQAATGGSAAAGSAATQATTTPPSQQTVRNAVDAAKSTTQGIGESVKGWVNRGVDAAKNAFGVAKSGVDAGKEVVSSGAKRMPVIGAALAGGLSAYDDLSQGKSLGRALGVGATRAVYGGVGTALGALGGAAVTGLATGGVGTGVGGFTGGVAGGVKGDNIGKVVGEYYFGDLSDDSQDPVFKQLPKTTSVQQPLTKPAVGETQATAQSASTQTAASAAQPAKKASLRDSVQGVAPTAVGDGSNNIRRYDIPGQSPLFTNTSAADNEAFIGARKQALNSDPGWKPPTQPDLPYVDDTTTAGMAENDRRDQMRVANERTAYQTQGLAERAAANRRSEQNQFAYEQMAEGADPRTLAIMRSRDAAAQERAQNAALAQANDPRNVLLSQIQGKLASGGQLTRSGVAALQGVMGDNTHRYATDVGAATSRYGADTSANVSKYATDVGAATAKMHDETARSGQRVASQHNEMSNKLAESRLKHDIRRDDMARTAEGDKRFSELIKTSPHVLGVDKDGRPAVDERKLADFSTWLKNQSGGVDANGRPQSLSAAMVGMNPDEAGSAMAAANDAFTVHSVFKRHAANNGLHPTTIGDGVPNFTIDNLSLSDPLRNQAGWLSSTRETMSPFSTGKVARMKTAQGTTVAVPLGSLSPEEYNAFVLHSQLINNQRR